MIYWIDNQIGLARVKKDGKSGFIDHSGVMVSSCMWDYADDLAKDWLW